MLDVIFQRDSVHIHVTCPASGDVSQATIEAIKQQLIMNKEEIKEAIKAAAEAEKEQIRANIEKAIQEGLKKLGWTEQDRDEVLGIIGEIFTPEGEIAGTRTVLQFSFKGDEPGAITANLIAPDNDALGALWKKYAVDPAIAAETAPFEPHGDQVIVAGSLTQDGETLTEYGKKLDRNQVINIQIALFEGYITLLKAQRDGTLEE